MISYVRCQTRSVSSAVPTNTQRTVRAPLPRLGFVLVLVPTVPPVATVCAAADSVAMLSGLCSGPRKLDR